MRPERWQRIEQVYFAALARAAEEREVLLDEECRGDEELRREVESLLDAHQEASGFLAEPAMQVVARKIALEPSLAKAGQVINQYQVLSPLGAGGMGVVYKALDLKLGRTVALKMLAPALVSDETARLRFLREARAASMLSHPSICTVFEVGQSDDLIYIAMQYLEGRTLADLLAEAPVPIETGLGYALDIADALNDAHRHGVIHRDIKPTNIMVNERGRAVVLDFGLAKYIGANRTQGGEAPTLLQITDAMSPIGTPAYMSPEQARGGRLDERSDIFSFGVTLYEIVTGVRPFGGQSPVDTLHAILYEEPPSPREIKPAISCKLEEVIIRTLAKDPDRRCQSFSELHADLALVLSQKSWIHSAVGPGPGLAEATAPNDATVTDGERLNLTAGRRAAITQRIVRPLGGLRNAAMIAGAALIVAVSLVWRSSSAPSEADMIASLKHTQLVDWKEQSGGTENKLGSISPDGKMIAYVSRSDGNGNIWIKQTSGGDAVQITKDNWHNWSPVWSPDGGELAYLSRRGQQTGIWRIAAFGGTPKLVVTLDGLNGQTSRWSKDGKTIYFEASGNLFAVDAGSGESRSLTEFDPNDSPAWEFSIPPAEDRIAYVESRNGQQDIWVRMLSGGDPIQITNDPEDDDNPFWHPDGKRVIYNTRRGGIFQIYEAFPDSRPPVQITFADHDSFVTGISDDGTRIAVSSTRQDSDLWAVDVPGGEEKQITSDVHIEMWPDLSPDNQSIAYQVSDHSDNIWESRILLQALARTELPPQLSFAGVEPRWSPDGQRLAFLRLAGMSHLIWTIDAAGTNERQLCSRRSAGIIHSVNPYNRFDTSEFSWSPDSRRLAFVSGAPEPGVWLISLDGQNEIKASAGSDAGGMFYSPLWSADGNRIAYVSRTETGAKAIWKICVTEIGGNHIKTVHQSNSLLRLLGWSASGNELAFATVEGKASFASRPAKVDFVEVKMNGGSPRGILSADPAYLYNNQLSPDRQTIAVALRQDGKDNIWLFPVTGGAPRKITSNNDPRLFLSSLSWSPDGRSIYYARQARFGLMSLIANFK